MMLQQSESQWWGRTTAGSQKCCCCCMLHPSLHWRHPSRFGPVNTVARVVPLAATVAEALLFVLLLFLFFFFLFFLCILICSFAPVRCCLIDLSLQQRQQQLHKLNMLKKVCEELTRLASSQEEEDKDNRPIWPGDWCFSYHKREKKKRKAIFPQKGEPLFTWSVAWPKCGSKKLE